MKVLSGLILALLFVASTAGAQTVDEVVAKHIEASGGKAKLAALKTMKLSASVQVAGQKIPVVTTIVDQKASRTDVTFGGMTQVIVIEKTGGWHITPWGGKTEPEKLSEDKVKEGQEQNDLTGPLYNYKEKGNKVELLGREEMEGTDVFKLKVTRPTGDVSYQYIDASNYLLLKEISKRKFQDKEEEGERLLSNYKMVDGINMPFTIEARPVGQSTGEIVTVESIEVNPKVDEGIFKMPAVAVK